MKNALAIAMSLWLICMSGISCSVGVKEKDEKQSEVMETITRQQRCDIAKRNFNMLNTKKAVYEENERGDLVQLNDAQIAQRKSEIETSIRKYCDNE